MTQEEGGSSVAGDGGLTLNLVNEPVASVAKEDKKRKREDHGDDDHAVVATKDIDKKHKSDRKSKKRRAATEGSDGDGKKSAADARKDFISSLFRHNPEVPRLDLADVTPAREEVFTERAFSDVGVHPYLAKNLEQSSGISRATAVQSLAIPPILAGKDCLVKSQTGSGKTLAYALPLIQMLAEARPEITRADGVVALVVVPTRELAAQSFEWFEKLCRTFARIIPGVLVGGEKKKSEKARLRKGVNILVSTPGRLIDHIKHTKCLSLKNVRYLVFDEADRMLELGYERDVKAVIEAIDEQKANAAESGHGRQTLLLSATLTSGIEQLSEVSMKHPVFVDAAAVSTGEDEHKKASEESLKVMTTPESLKQTFAVVPAKLRLVTLAAFVLWKCRFGKARKMLVFMSTQDMVDFHAELFERCLNGKKRRVKDGGEHDLLRSDGGDGEDEVLGSGGGQPIELHRLHGSMGQSERTAVFNRFRDSDSGGVLLCTDVAARGLDLPSVDWIVQYNPPVSRADYVHRVGRTARIGAGGSSLLMLLPSEAEFVKELEGESLLLAEMTVEQVLEKLAKQRHLQERGGRRRPCTLEEAATDVQMKMEESVARDEELHTLASQAYVSYVRSYASYPKESRQVFCFKELHLGHLAKSFALRDPPSKITGVGKGQWVRNDERKREQQRKNASLKQEEKVIRAQKRRINQRELVVSEFSTGFDGIELRESAKVPKAQQPNEKKKKHKKKHFKKKSTK